LVHYANGDVFVGEVMGDLSLSTVNGVVTVQRGQRDVNLNNLGGALTVENVQGDVRLRGGLPGGKHHCQAQGDIVVRWPVGAPLLLQATAPQITNRLPLQDVEEAENSLSGRLGDGETVLVLQAQGRIVLKEQDESGWAEDYFSDQSEPAWDEFGSEFAKMGSELAGLGEQLSSEIGARMSELSAKMEERFGADFAQKMADKAARRTEKAVERAMREAERARRRASAWSPPPPPRPKKESRATAEEQVKILGMLEKGIISVEEAETLLRALEE
jgi:hypothetical protein